MSDWITEYAEKEWQTAAFTNAKDLEACLRWFASRMNKDDATDPCDPTADSPDPPSSDWRDLDTWRKRDPDQTYAMIMAMERLLNEAKDAARWLLPFTVNTPHTANAVRRWPWLDDVTVCPSCDGQGDVQLHDEGGNGMYWGCMACGGTGRVNR